VLGVAVAGTVGIALGAFWLSFTSLAALARRCGIPGDRAWVWPLTVDGVIVVATVSLVAMGGSGGDRPTARYPWVLLSAGAGVSVLGNASHAIVAAQARVPAVLAALVAAVPPVVLVAITHLTVELTHRPGPATAVPARTPPAVPGRPRARAAEPGGEGGHREHGRAGEALRLREDTSLTNREIAARLGVHPSTVGRHRRLRDRRRGPSHSRRALLRLVDQGELADRINSDRPGCCVPRACGSSRPP
jgi:DNA-binding CsgD family transcriptional regulator